MKVLAEPVGELFALDLHLSPRLKWKQAHGVETRDNFARAGTAQWLAWVGDDEAHASTGETEVEALIALAQRQGWKLWNET